MRAKTLLRLFARTPAWTAVRARDRVRALLLDLAWRARSNGANGALLRGRADEERKGDRWSRDARERARAQLCKAHALSCGAYEKARFIYYLLYHPRSRLRARARFHSFLSSYTNTQEQHSGPSCAVSALAFVLLIFPHTLRLPFLLHRSEYSRDLLENLATAGAADAARVSVPARRIAAGARPRRGHRVPAVSIRGQGR